MIRYFAYGRNTNVAEFNRRVPAAYLVGRAFLPNYTLVLREFADIVPKKNAKVWGVLWDVPVSWIPELDSIEEEYHKKTVFVNWNHTRVKAMVYRMISTDDADDLMTCSQEYVNYLTEGYKANKLPLSQIKKALQQSVL